MRLSMDTLLILAHLGDKEAEYTAIWFDKNRDAEVWSMNGGHIGSGWVGIPFIKETYIGPQPGDDRIKVNPLTVGDRRRRPGWAGYSY